MPQVDATLRHMLEELSRMDAADAQAVLATLDPPARSRVRSLLKREEQSGETATVGERRAGELAGKGLSGWLISRIEAGDEITPATREALLAAASRLPAGDCRDGEASAGHGERRLRVGGLFGRRWK